MLEASSQRHAEAGPALRQPIRPAADRHRFELPGLAHRPGITGLLERIVIEGRDLGLAHAGAGKPLRDMDVASSTSVNTLSEPVPVTGQVVLKASPTSTNPGCR